MIDTSTTTTDTAELHRHAQLLLDSVTANDPSLLPLAPRYRATENAIPANLAMMTVYRFDTDGANVGAWVLRSISPSDPYPAQVRVTVAVRGDIDNP